MKIFIAFFVIALASIAYGKTLEEQWADYKKKFKRNYADEEDIKRFEIFKDKIAAIEAHNAKYEKGEVTFKAGINRFTDRTEEERKKQVGGLKPLPRD